MSKQYYKAEQYHSRESLGYLLRRGRNLLSTHVEELFKEKLGNANVSFVHWVILMCLRDDLAHTPSELSQYICYDSGALTRVIDQMEERGLLGRKRSGKDRRVVVLSLTPAGRKMLDSLIGIVVDFYNEILSDFKHAEIDMLINLLTRLVGKLDKFKNEA